MIGEELEKAGLKVASLNLKQQRRVIATEYALLVMADDGQESEYIIVVYERVKKKS